MFLKFRLVGKNPDKNLDGMWVNLPFVKWWHKNIKSYAD